MNQVILIGNLTRKPEIRFTRNSNGNLAICRFAIAVSDGYGERQRTSFINIVVFGRTGENCERYLNKGSKVAVSGRLQTGSYEKDGRKVYTTEVIASEVEFLRNSNSSDSMVNGDPSVRTYAHTQPGYGQSPMGYADDSNDNEDDMFIEDDIPF